MKLLSLIAILIFAALLMAGCGGNIMSPQHTQIDSHAVTTTTTEVQTQDAKQSDNRPVCVGIIVLGSCNTSQTTTQAASRATTQPTASMADNVTLPDLVRWLVITCIIVFWFVVLMVGIRKILGIDNDMSEWG